ncbi:MAG: threonine synthase [Candidatus Methanomethylophilaceae archaeon]|nr:threonine synthase [Candidatus Methanomethylophilaceae archaeon]
MARPDILKCVLCGREHEPSAERYICDTCGLDGTLDVLYNINETKKNITKDSLSLCRDMSMWRYRDILPVLNDANMPDLAVGWTPLYENKRMASKYGVNKLYIKDDGRNPTASLKDRASAVGVAKAMDFGQKVVACASTGNAASSLSGFAAVSGLESYIFVPEKAPAAKVTQLLVYGANVVLVKGDYADAFDLATAAIEKFGWYNRNCAINPYLVEGKKTCAMEIAEQLNWEIPDRVFISVGDGCCIGGLYKGFRDLLELGLIDRMPKITGVQAEGSSPIYKAITENSERVHFGPADTIADSISVGAPRNWAKALRAIRASGGTAVTVTDDEILSAIPELARSSGVFGEPAGVTGFAGFRKTALAGETAPDETVAVVVTGNGLKDIESAVRSVGQALSCAPDIEEFSRLIALR